jgi:hypothetical protein
MVFVASGGAQLPNLTMTSPALPAVFYIQAGTPHVQLSDRIVAVSELRRQLQVFQAL